MNSKSSLTLYLLSRVRGPFHRMSINIVVGIQESPTLENREKEKREKTKGEEN